MNSVSKKIVLPAMLFVLLAAVQGCGQKSSSDKNTNQTTEFFKEIENNATVQENGEAMTDTAQNTEVVSSSSETPAVETPTETPSAAVTSSAPDKPTIQDIQQALKNAGLYHGKVDGVSGPKTKRAVEAFQSQNGLKADGKVGPKTWLKLKTFLNSSSAMEPAAQTQTTTSAAEEPAAATSETQSSND